MSKKLLVSAEFFCGPVWFHDSKSVDDVGNVDLDSLPISLSLKEDLLDWSAELDSIFCEEYPPDSEFKTPEDEINFNKNGLILAKRLHEELKGLYEVFYKGDDGETLDVNIVSSDDIETKKY